MKTPIVITGGFGFVGSNLVFGLNQRGIVPYVIDRWSDNDPKARNIKGLRFKRIYEEDLTNVSLFPTKPIIVCLGARVDTREKMSEGMWEDNVETPLRLEQLASKFIYASSGATYGASTDFIERVEGLIPLNDYATTKYHLDTVFFGMSDVNPRTYGLRFTNVFGPHEVHKGDMASLVTKGLLKLPPLYQLGQDSVSVLNRPDLTRLGKLPNWSLFKHPAGEITRDFIAVSDVVSVILHFIDQENIPSGIYNVGSGLARSFEDLVKAVENLPIEYTPLPDSLKNQYQRHTCADLTKLREVAGYKAPFLTLEEGVEKTREWMKEEGLL